MQHLDDETLALLALGENDTTPDVEAHLTNCRACRSELEEMRTIVGAGRAGGPLVAPPAGLWERIAAEVQDPATGDTPDHTALAAPSTWVEPGGRLAPAARPDDEEPPTDGRGAGAATAPQADPQPGPELETADRTRRSSRLLWVAAAGFAVGVAGTAVVLGLTRQQPEAEVLASAELDPLPGWSQSGAARVEVHDGRRVLTVEIDPADVEGYREVWLLDTAVERLVSVGVLAGDSGTFALPPDLDLGEFLIVDVSREPYDGDPAHSGDSIVRGELS